MQPSAIYKVWWSFGRVMRCRRRRKRRFQEAGWKKQENNRSCFHTRLFPLALLAFLAPFFRVRVSQISLGTQPTMSPSNRPDVRIGSPPSGSRGGGSRAARIEFWNFFADEISRRNACIASFQCRSLDNDGIDTRLHHIIEQIVVHYKFIERFIPFPPSPIYRRQRMRQHFHGIIFKARNKFIQKRYWSTPPHPPPPLKWLNIYRSLFKK